MKITASKIEMMRRQAPADHEKLWAAAAQTLPWRRRRDAVASVARLLRQRFQRAPLDVASTGERGAPQEPASPATFPLRAPRPVPGSDQAAVPATGPLRASQRVPEPAPAQDHTAGTAPAPEADAAPEHVSLPPHPLRLAAFLIDLALVAAVAAVATALTWSLAEFIVVLVVVWVIYQTGMVWLTGGLTVGKSVCSLSVRHIDGSAPDRTWAGFGWAFGRASAGYLIVDMLGLGVLVALRNSRRRCVHDYVFASEVVLHPADASEPGPGLMDRIDQLNKDIDAGLEANTKRSAPLWKLWKRLLVLASPCVGAWQVSTRIFATLWRHIKKRLAAHAQSAGSAQAATALTGAKLAAVVAAITIVTGAAAAVTTEAYVSKAPPITGNWANMIRIVQAGPDSYRAFLTAAKHDSVTGCIWHKGVPVWQITGRGPNYTGSEYLANSNNTGQCSGFTWSPTTFRLIRPDTLRVCDPAITTGPTCYEVRKN
jgi:uncharacterized RDD family membrane protein YckC